MSVVMVGLSHRTAPVALRERLTVPKEELGSALDGLKSMGGVEEAVVLSTCNRLEIYARPAGAEAGGLKSIAHFLHRSYADANVKDALYEGKGLDAVRHLFRVAAGLDSLVVGETEILGQVKAAYLFAHHHGTTGKITNVLFQRALRVGKQVRTQTGISQGGRSVGSVAVQLAERIFGNLHNRRILLLGAGKMAEVTARRLLSQKAGEIVILNRTLPKAEELAKVLNGQAGPMEHLQDELLNADIVICSSGAQEPFITPGMVAPVMKARRERSLYFIDVAVPRNVEPGVHRLDNAYVYNIDDLQALVDENMARRRGEVGEAEALVEERAREFEAWAEGVKSQQATYEKSAKFE